jgi:membrane-associated phospholipid phosphatase
MHTLSHPPPQANTTSAAMPQFCPTYRRFFLPLLLAAAAVASLALDLSVGMKTRRWNDKFILEHNKDIKNLHDNLGWFDTFEPFGHGRGVVLVLLALHQLDPKRRWAIPRLAACALAAGGAANLLKLIVARTRPNDLPLDFSGSVWDTFGDWLPMFSSQSGLQSFPSAHTAAAAGFAAALIWLYPQGRWFFISLVALVGCQRIFSGAHFPSDVLIGAAAGCLAATFFLYVGRLPILFDRWELRWGRVK